jgi:hypothetical protein
MSRPAAAGAACINDKVCFLIKNLPAARHCIAAERIVTSRDSRSQTRAGARRAGVRYAKRISILSRNATPRYKYQRVE